MSEWSGTLEDLDYSSWLDEQWMKIELHDYELEQRRYAPVTDEVVVDVDADAGYQGSWEHNSGHGAHYGRFG